MIVERVKRQAIILKSLNQIIQGFPIAGAGDVNGRILQIQFEQEAKQQLTKDSIVYLAWTHKELGIKGLNVFTKKDDNLFEIQYPNSMLREGHVLCNIKVTDEVSMVQSLDFEIHVLSDVDDGSDFIASNDYEAFKQSIIDLTKTQNDIATLVYGYRQRFQELEDRIKDTDNNVHKLLDILTDGDIENVAEAVRALKEELSKEIDEALKIIEV